MRTVRSEFGWIHFRCAIGSVILDSDILTDVAEVDALRRLLDAQRVPSTNAIASPCLYALA